MIYTATIKHWQQSCLIGGCIGTVIKIISIDYDGAWHQAGA
jgi:hypothetical protein